MITAISISHKTDDSRFPVENRMLVRGENKSWIAMLNGNPTPLYLREIRLINKLEDVIATSSV